MPSYLYACPQCDDIYLTFPMEPGPPPTAPCPICGELASRRFLSVPIRFVGPGFSSSGKFDRPDERIDAEVKESQDIDVTTGLTWEETDERLAKRKAYWGHRIRKDVHLPEKGQIAKQKGRD